MTQVTANLFDALRRLQALQMQIELLSFESSCLHLAVAVGCMISSLDATCSTRHSSEVQLTLPLSMPVSNPSASKSSPT